MHLIPKNPSQIYSEQSISSAEETHPSSGNMRRSRSSSPLGSSPLAKRRRGDAGIDNRYKYGITTDTNSLTIEDTNSCFAEEFEATYPSYKGDWRLNNDFFPSDMPCDSESQERIEEGGENQSNSEEDFLTNLHTLHTDDSLAEEDGEMSSEGESEANHAGLSSGVWELPPGLKRMRINYNALQNFIEITSPPDLKMSERALRQAFKKSYKKEACPGAAAFKEELRKLRAKQVENNPNQPTRKAYTKVGHKALQNFIKVTSLDLTMGAGVLQEEYIKIHGEEQCPSLSVFEGDLTKLRDKWAKENPGRPTL